MEKFEFITDENAKNVRIDKFLAEYFSSRKPEITRSKIQNLIEQNKIFFDEKIVKSPSTKLQENKKITVEISFQKTLELKPKEIAFEIIFEDEDLIVINKPSVLTVHPGAGNNEDTLVNALLFSHGKNLSKITDFRPGIVHRLDKDTSGLMLVAKNDFTHLKLSEKLQNREIKRSYLAIIFGKIIPPKGKIDRNITRSRSNRLKMTTSRNEGKKAVTNYETKKIFLDGFASILECKLETGRTHQIRAHLESQKHSIIGDQTYNSCKKNLTKEQMEFLNIDEINFIKNFPRQALHSYKINFIHPRTEKEMEFKIDFPEDIKKLLEILRKND
jgi:23S rRNA pseudouridine1911/1915/1917 synthase